MNFKPHKSSSKINQNFTILIMDKYVLIHVNNRFINSTITTKIIKQF